MRTLLYILIAIIVTGIWFVYRKQWQNLVRPLTYQAEFSGSPHYVAGCSNGSPLSELGSHCGFKAVPEKEAAACNALFATVTSLGAGRLCNFAVNLIDEKGRAYFRFPKKRKVHFRPYAIEEQAEENGLHLSSRLFFLKHNVAVLELEWEGTGEGKQLKPAFLLLPTGGRDLENPYPHFNGLSFVRKEGNGLLFYNLHRVPGLRLHAFFLPGSGGTHSRKVLHGPWTKTAPGVKNRWSVIISFSADSKTKAIGEAEESLREIDKLVTGAAKRWQHFEEKLPVPPGTTADPSNADTFKLAAWALHNNLYAPRGKMELMGSVPAKVYFPFIWGWDTPQHVLGLSETDPRLAGDVLLTQLRGNTFAPAATGRKLKIKGITVLSRTEKNQIPSKINDSMRGVLNLYSQPPLQSWAALCTYQRFSAAEEKMCFLRKVLPPLRENIRWWEENRRLPGGFFSYLNGLESGLDDSPRFYPRSFLPSFIVGLIPRFLSAVDLNCWLFQSYMNLSYLCREAGQAEDVEIYLNRAYKLGKKIDEELWSGEDGAWLDRRNGSFARIFTPVIWWPAFLGASSSLERINTVIKNHLLQPGKFWGEHGIPSVSFDDKTYNRRKEGYYWRGQIWMVNNYSALEVLFRFGYTSEATELHRRVVETLQRSRGFYETYNASTGDVGWSSRGPGDPAVMQFGMSAAWATQILLHRYQNFCYIFPHTRELRGHIQWATTFADTPPSAPPCAGAVSEKAILQVQVPGSTIVPRIFLKSYDGKPLLQSSLLKVQIDDPTGSITAESRIIMYWKNESYTLRPGIDFMIKPQEAFGKTVVSGQ